MAEFPSLPLWTDAYLGDTQHFGVMEHGAYLLLLIAAWRSEDGGLPDNDHLLARYARCTTRQWHIIKPLVMAPWTLCDDGKWRQNRLEKERCYIREKSTSQSRKAKLKWLKDKASRDAAASERHMPDACRTDAPTPIPIPNRRDDVVSAPVLDAVRDVWPDLDQRIELPGLSGSLGMIQAWLGDGADLDRDILPTITKVCRGLKSNGRGPPRSFSYFRQAVADAKATNERGLPDGQPSAARTARQQPARFKNGFAAMAYARLHGAGGQCEPGVVMDTPDPDQPADARDRIRLASGS